MVDLSWINGYELFVLGYFNKKLFIWKNSVATCYLNIEGNIRRGKRPKQLLDDLKGNRGDTGI
jgi:hypothetical protein